MSQNNITINNGTGKEVRAAINAALDSLATDFSGPNEPPVKWALMKWADTTNLILKMRNLSNTGWINVMDLNTGLALNSLEPGFVCYYAVNTAPTGWLECNGRAVSRTTYAALFAKIGTYYGIGDGSSTFNLPNLSGIFIRGIDNGRGADPGRVFGVYQNDENKAHTHTMTFGTSASEGWGSGGRLSQGADSAGTYVYNTGESGSESRPKNIALLPCIKY